jgi:lysophospholipase L1-like esterase
LLVAEFGFRALAPVWGITPARLARARELLLGSGASWYQPQPYYGWALASSLRSSSEHWFNGPPVPVERTPGVGRILCLGGSTTASGNSAGAAGAFPHFLGEILTERLGTSIEVVNAGISGWTSAEMLCAWFLYFQDYRPDLLVIHEAVNDCEPRFRPDFRRDYAHWRHPWKLPEQPAWLRFLARHSDLVTAMRLSHPPPSLDDATVWPASAPSTFDGQRLPPETIEPLRRNWLSMVQSQAQHGGSTLFATLPPAPIRPGQEHLAFRAGIAEHNQLMRSLSEDTGCLLVDLERLALDRDPQELAGWYLDLVHVTPQANRWKAEAIAAGVQAGLPQILATKKPR